MIYSALFQTPTKLYLIALLSTLFCCCRPITAPPQETALKPLPGLQFVTNLGIELQNKYPLDFKEGGLLYANKAARYKLNFTTNKKATVDEIRILALSVLHDIEEQLIKEPTIQARLLANPRIKKHLIESIQLQIGFGDGFDNLRSAPSIALFDCINGNMTYCVNYGKQGRIDLQCILEERYEEAKAAYKAAPPSQNHVAASCKGAI